MVTNVSPSITASPLLTLMLVMVPEVSASMLFCIFMASRITTVSPALTLSPTFTLISLMVPGRGATTGLPGRLLFLHLLHFLFGRCLLRIANPQMPLRSEGLMMSC